MCAKWILHWQPAPGAMMSTQTYAEVVKAVESLSSTRIGRWNATCSLNRPVVREVGVAPGEIVTPARELFGVSFSDWPGRHFLVLRHEHLVVEAEASVESIMEKLQLYRHRSSVAYEGLEYSLGDFHVRVGKAVQASSEALRGILLEVKFAACASLESGRALCQDFLSIWQEIVASHGLNGRFVLLEPTYVDYGLGDIYGAHHTALQFVLLSAHFMAARS